MQFLLNRERLPFGGTSTTIVHGRVKFTAACFGKPEDWSISPFQRPGDMMKDPIVAERLGYAFQALKATRVYATNPTEANTQVIDPYRLNRYIRLPYGVTLIRNRDIPADGTMLYPGDASAMSAGGCPRIVVVRGERMACAHAGRDSLIDRERVKRNVPGRKHETVVEALLNRVSSPTTRNDVHAWVFFSIEAHRFVHDVSHKIYGTYNHALLAYISERWGMAARSASIDVDDFPFPYKACRLHLDLPQLIKAQFIGLGVPARQINLDYAYGSPDLLYDTRGPEREKRNLVAIVRHK